MYANDQNVTVLRSTGKYDMCIPSIAKNGLSPHRFLKPNNKTIVCTTA
jgi:hypothetical protein